MAAVGADGADRAQLRSFSLPQHVIADLVEDLLGRGGREGCESDAHGSDLRVEGQGGDDAEATDVRLVLGVQLGGLQGFSLDAFAPLAALVFEGRDVGAECGSCGGLAGHEGCLRGVGHEKGHRLVALGVVVNSVRAVGAEGITVGLTFDQKVQLWNTAGTWFAGIAGVAAVITSLYLATRTSRVRLKAYATMMLAVGHGGPNERLVGVSVTNVGERPVTITGISWRVGRRKSMRYAAQMWTVHLSSHLPCELAHGHTGDFRLSLDEAPAWPQMFREKILKDDYLDTLRIVISSSVGTDVVVRPAESILRLLAK